MKKHILSVFLRLSVSCITILCATSCNDPEVPANPSVLFEPFILPEGFALEEYVEGLNLPTSLAFAPGPTKRLFVNELQTGIIWVIQEDTLLQQPFAQLETFVSGGFPVAGENGSIGIAFDPAYESNGYVYISQATWSGVDTLGRVIRFRDENNRGVDETVLLDSIPCSSAHQVQSLRFGPDGKLYLAVGDAFRADWAQDLTRLPGSILRMNTDGSVPEDNPLPNSYIYAYGMRNPFDLIFRENGDLLTGDNGVVLEDELNVVSAGGNYGWPAGTGPLNTPLYTDPVHTWLEAVSPAGMAWYKGSTYPARYRDKLFLVLFGSTYSDGPSPVAKRIQVVDIQGAGQNTRLSFEDFLTYNLPTKGNPLDIAIGPDGWVYFTDIFRGKVFRVVYTP